MFARIFAISHGVRAYFAPEPSAFARRGARRAKNALENASGGLSITVFMNIQSFLHHAVDRFRLHVRRPSIAQRDTNTYTFYQLSDRRPPPTTARSAAKKILGSPGVRSEFRYFARAFAAFFPISARRVEIQLYPPLVTAQKTAIAITVVRETP